ncbi:MAG: hypothetical protein LC791_02200 [Acidobacteria bacterium]|nr:hypothetical protein [Acidobacteriota bacterium]
MDLLDLLKRPEGKTLEFKRDLSSPDGVLEPTPRHLIRRRFRRSNPW